METLRATLTTCYPALTGATAGGRAADGAWMLTCSRHPHPSERNPSQICLETMKTGETFRKTVNDSCMCSHNWPLLEKEDICNFSQEIIC